MAPHPVDDWQRLGTLLKRRRPQLDQRYRTRRVFADENHLTDKTVQEIENAYRQTFTQEMLSAIEVAYRLPAGTIERVLNDPDITELPAPISNHQREPDRADIPTWVDLRDLPEWEQHIWRIPGLSVEERQTAILIIYLQRRELDDDTEALLHLYALLTPAAERNLGRGGGASPARTSKPSGSTVNYPVKTRIVR